MPLLPSHRTVRTTSTGRTRILPRALLAVALAALAGAAAVLADWWIAVPQSTRATYVGGRRCIECHDQEYRQWQSSHHDLAMQVATTETVLADFNNASFEHHGITSRMFRRGDKFFVSTEGPDGAMHDFEIKYCFGVEPLQQYMVEFDRRANTPDNATARLQVLRLSWDTQRKEWFYLPPPDVPEKLEPNDALHWTGVAQCWNTMCAECHSTNLQKNYDAKSLSYATTFTDIDVNCEACHGPGSIHVELATAYSLFWDRRLGYGLPNLKDPGNSQPEIQTCAPCHSRRRVLESDLPGGAHYWDHFALELPSPLTYFANGQILDEVYEYGSFLQSKMHQRGVRCCDCHDPHSTRLKHTGNQVCTSCHQHPAGRYDTPGHHRHRPGSTGSQCVECHMPSTTYMEIDPRRDHSFQVPRPDLSLEHGFPNACTACHLDRANLEPGKREPLKQYRDWVLAARDDQEIAVALQSVDRWAQDACAEWFPVSAYRDAVHPGQLLAGAWKGESDFSDVGRLVRNRNYPGIFRAAGLQIMQHAPQAIETAKSAIKDSDPTVRAAAVQAFQQLIPAPGEMNQLDESTRAQLINDLRKELAPLFTLLDDEFRIVRVNAAAVLTNIPPELLPSVSTGHQRESLQRGVGELVDSWRYLNDRAAGHAAIASIYESQGRVREAMDAYRTAIRVEPGEVVARSNLARLLEQAASTGGSEKLLDEVRQLRKEELTLLARDAKLAPQIAEVQYRYGLALYLDGQPQAAVVPLERAWEREPRRIAYALAVATLHKELQNWDAALQAAEAVVAIEPNNPSYRLLLDEIRTAGRRRR